MMKKALVYPAVAALTAAFGSASAEGWADAPSGTYESEETHRYIGFRYLHRGLSRPILTWDQWTGVLEWDADNPENSSINVTIDIASIDSGVDIFDEHLVGERWFNAEEFPEATFTSSSVEKIDDTTGKVSGDLTIKGVTKPVTLDVVFHSAALDGRSNMHKIGFSAETEVMRSDFDLGMGVPATSDEVEIMISAEFQMPAE